MPACTGAPRAGLERSGAATASQANEAGIDSDIESGDWLRDAAAVEGVSRLHAGLKHRAYARHRHDSYTIALTESGVQEFGYRNGVHHSLPGQVLVLHPDELHDGRPGTEAGFSYRTLYMDPDRIYEAVRSASTAQVSLPFVDPPVIDDPLLARAIAQAFDGPLEPLRADELVEIASASLLRAAQPQAGISKHRLLGEPVLKRAREFLDAHFTRIVTAEELEHQCSESRFTLASQFRRRYGTSPYRYLLMRRLDFVRARLPGATSLAELAHEAGFADQAHMTRMFKSAYGLTPDVFARLSRS